MATATLALQANAAEVNVFFRNFNLHEHPLKVLKVTGSLYEAPSKAYHHYHRTHRSQKITHEEEEQFEGVHHKGNKPHHELLESHHDSNEARHDFLHHSDPQPGEYLETHDDDQPGVFSPELDKPFERAQTLTGKYYMPELAYARRNPPAKYMNHHATAIYSRPLQKASAVSVSGALFTVGLPVSLGS